MVAPVLGINILSITIALVLLVHLLATSKKNWRTLHFAHLLAALIAIIAFDTMGWCNGTSNPAYPIISKIGNFLFYSFHPVIGTLWTMYVCVVLSMRKKHRRMIYCVLALICAVNIVLVGISQKTGWYYSIAEGNIYKRGPIFWLPIVFSFVMIIFSFVLVIVYRKRISHKDFFTMQVFPVLPMIALATQALAGGYSLTLYAILIDALLIYLNMQKDQASVDYLTQLSNRKEFDARLDSNWHDKVAFSTFMIDIDEFKAINDNYGHNVGDLVLREISNALSMFSLKNKFFCARYGGDEFCIIARGVSPERLPVLAEEITRRCGLTDLKFNVRVSVGYATVDYTTDASQEDYMDRVDAAMYQVKSEKRRK